MAEQVTSVFDRGRTLMRGWPTQQLPLTCLALLCMHNKSWGWQGRCLRTDLTDWSCRQDLYRLDVILFLALPYTQGWLKAQTCLRCSLEGSQSHQSMLNWCVWYALLQVINTQGTKMETKGMKKRENSQIYQNLHVFFTSDALFTITTVDWRDDTVLVAAKVNEDR